MPWFVNKRQKMLSGIYFWQQEKHRHERENKCFGEYVQPNRNSREGLPINKNKLTRRKKEKQKETGKSIQPDRQSRVGWPINTVFDPFFPLAILNERPLHPIAPTKQNKNKKTNRLYSWKNFTLEASGDMMMMRMRVVMRWWWTHNKWIWSEETWEKGPARMWLGRGKSDTCYC